MDPLTQLKSLNAELNKIYVPKKEVRAILNNIGVTYNNSLNNYISNLLLKLKIKNLEFSSSKFFIDFYKDYKNVKVKLLRLKFEKDNSVNQISKIRIITYEGSSTEDWEYLKLKDVGILSNFIYKNKLKLIKKINFFYQTQIKHTNQLKNKVKKMHLKIDVIEKKGHSIILKKILKILKTQPLYLNNITNYKGESLGYYPGVPVTSNHEINKNVTSINLVKNSKFKLLITTTELNNKGLPIIWEIEYDNLNQWLLNNLIKNTPFISWEFLFKK